MKPGGRRRSRRRGERINIKNGIYPAGSRAQCGGLAQRRTRLRPREALRVSPGRPLRENFPDRRSINGGLGALHRLVSFVESANSA